MAAYSHHHSRVGSRTSLFNGGGLGDQELPNGSCNFRDLSIGTRAPICGCRRFYLNTAHVNWHDSDPERAWCFCGHHACFHDAFSQMQRTPERGVVGSRIEGVDVVQNANLAFSAQYGQDAQATSTPSKPLTGLGIRPDSRSEPQSINTRVWQALNDFARNQEGGGALDEAAKLPSTAAASVVEEVRPSPNRSVQERLRQSRPMGPPVNIPQGPAPRQTEDYSATEVATPSMAGTPDFRATASSSNQMRTSPGHLQPGHIHANDDNVRPSSEPSVQQAGPSTATEHERPATSNPYMSTQDVQSMLRAYGHRLDVLESLSFNHVPVNEIQDKFELFDERVLDLEQWRTDEEQIRNATEPPRRRLLPTETGSFGSNESFDMNAAAHTEAAVLATLAANAETHPRIDALESRVSDLEGAALPSFARPWHVQLVLLPWGRELRGVWFSPMEATQHSLRSATQASEEWSGAQSAPKLSFKSTTHGAWTTESIEAWASEAQEWLSPKACGPNGTVFQRLESRGLVRDITLTAPDARHITNVIRDALRPAAGTTSELGLEQACGYQALQEPFIPLRKVRKSSRLRFLGPAEMITSASWTAGFLDSSVFMKVTDGHRRLYVTTPEAYIQNLGDHDWTWPRIKQLPPRDTKGVDQLVQPLDVIIEACWTYNDRLDRPLSMHSSFGSHASQWSTRSQLADMDAEEVDRQPISPQSELPIPRQRTASLPSSSSAAAEARELLPKRRVASFETAATVPMQTDEFVAKRRRISTSPEAERRGVNFTPRWSREPPSPFTSEAAVEGRSQGTSGRKRGNTPFAYATPHSNSNFISRRMEFVGGDGDTEADTDIAANKSDRGEDEWEGVEDGHTNVEMEDSSDLSSVPDDIDENDLDEGLTIYES